MIDRERIIRGLEQAKCEINPVSASRKVRLRAAVDDAISLLKEQEPLAVYEGKVNKCICGNEINRYYHPEYCGFCGKKLEWY